MSLSSGNLFPNRAFFVKSRVLNESFMVDTDSSCSVWPYRLALDKARQPAPTLHAVNLSLIKIYGQESFTPILT